MLLEEFRQFLAHSLRVARCRTVDESYFPAGLESTTFAVAHALALKNIISDGLYSKHISSAYGVDIW